MLMMAVTMGAPVWCFGQIFPTVRCVEFPATHGTSANFITHFDYINYNQLPTTIPMNTASNFLTPTSATTPSVFMPGYHPDAVRILTPLTAGQQAWFLAGHSASFDASGRDANGNLVNTSPVCPATFVLPPAITFAQPGLYTHQYLGQIDSGPAADARTTSVLALTPDNSPFTFSNLQYVPDDAANPSNALNPNSIYGDVTVRYGPDTTSNVRLQLFVDASPVTRGIIPIAYTGPESAPAPTLHFSVPDHTFGDPPFTIAATSTSTGELTYAVLSGPATQAGSTITLTGAGDVTLQVNQAAVANTYSSGALQAAFHVAKANAAVLLGGLSQPYTSFPISVNTVTQPAGLNVSTTYNGSTTSPIAIGNYAVAATVNDPNYQGTANGTLTITGPVSGTVVLTTRTQLSPLSAGGYSATITVTNSGTGTSQATQLQAASLGAANAGALPLDLGNIAPSGGSTTVTLNFPALAGAPGTTVLQKVSIKYTGGTSTTSGRATLPVLTY